MRHATIRGLNISVKGEYALQAIFDLALQPAGEPVKIADIARRQKIPQKFLELILSSLKQGGFVESRRGAEGGYRLARPAGTDHGRPGAAFRRRQESESPARTNAFTDLWKRVDASVAAILDHTTFAELARKWKESQTRYVPNWEI